MAVELAPYAIRVNAVCPGPIMTDMLLVPHQSVFDEPDSAPWGVALVYHNYLDGVLAAVPSEAGRQQLAETAPLGRVGRPQDIAPAVLYLASSDADWCTGQAISIDGGLSILK